MIFINNVKNLKLRVEKLLLNFPHLRDSDEKLISAIWVDDLKKLHKTKKFDSITARELLIDYINKRLPSSESIRRSRQKIQEKNEMTRGSNWKVRHKEEIDTRQNINKI